MDCTDCHNRVGHPFPNPEIVVDKDLAEGRLNRRLPYLKAWLVDLLNRDFTTQENALHLVEEAWEQYLGDFPNVPQDYPEDVAKTKQFLMERQQFMAKLIIRSKFLEPGISWRSFNDHMGHKDFPGCFRCHSGKHLNTAGDLIPVNCTLCHQIPIVLREGNTAKNALPPFAYRSRTVIGSPRCCMTIGRSSWKTRAVRPAMATSVSGTTIRLFVPMRHAMVCRG